jgi:hypothetical protein
VYLELAKERTVTKRTVLLRATIRLARPDSIFVQSDGTYLPLGPSAANVYIAVDGRKVSNDSLVDWRTSRPRVAHPFDAVGATRLGGGVHAVALVAEPVSLPLCKAAQSVTEDCTGTSPRAAGGSFAVAHGNMSVLVHPATNVHSQLLTLAAGPFDFHTYGLLAPDNTLTRRLPFASILSTAVPPGVTTVALGSGWLYAAGHSGDAMLTFLVDGRFPGNSISSWSNQDAWHGSELRGPLSVQAFLPPTRRVRQLSLATAEFPWLPMWVPIFPEDPVIYRVGAGTGMVVLSGGMKVAGSASGDYGRSPASSAIIVATSSGDLSLPRPGTRILLAGGTVDIPRGDSGIVMFSAKSRTHGGEQEKSLGGTISLWLTIDGRQVGPRVFQQLTWPDLGSQRSIAVSYLAEGRRALKTGQHDVQVWGRADGRFLRALMWRDLPLVWFD